MKTRLPLYQHPTQVVLVDDSPSFIESLEFQLKPRLPIKCFHNSVEALRYVVAAFRDDPMTHLPTVAPQRQSDEGGNLQSWQQIYRKVLDADRFDVPAVVVVDYAMPQIGGLDFCMALEGLPCKRILFTGEADEMIAVEAFNRGLIDRYIKKGDPNASEKLLFEITRLEQQYFAERSLANYKAIDLGAFGFLNEAVFVALVQTLIETHHFVEFFVFPDPSGILFFDVHGRATLMVIETKEGLRSHLEVAEAYCAPMELLQALREWRIVPFFWPSGGMYSEIIIDWQNYCKTANVCDGEERYYWAMFALPRVFLHGNVRSYHDFLRRDR